MVNFILPAFDAGIDVITNKFIDFVNNPEYKDFINEKVRVSAVYGSFPGCVWNGGRVITGNYCYLNNVEKSIQKYSSRNIPIRLTLTNSKIEEIHLLDSYGNQLLNLLNKKGNSVIINSEILENYIRAKYTHFDFILSTTRCERDIDIINQICNSNKYKLLVLDYRDNRNLDFLKQINAKERIEILVDEICASNCVNRKKHYELISNAVINHDDCFANRCLNEKTSLNYNNFYSVAKRNSDTFISLDFMENELIPLGFKTYKLVGRMSSSQYYFESLIYYFIKPDYRDFIRQELLPVYIESLNIS